MGNLVVDVQSFDPKPGDVVQHYKGGIYIVLMVGRDEATGKVVVIYSPCTPPKGKTPVWVRRRDDWVSCPSPGVPRYRSLALSSKRAKGVG